MEASRGAAPLRAGLAGDVRGLIGSRRLARRAAAGDERAFATIFERHHQELYRYCLAILRNPADAEDALQSTMSKALQALPGESREIKLRPWLFRVAHNESIAILRERRPMEATDDVDPLGGVEPDTVAERSERLRALVADLKSLPDRQRSALVMRELSGLEYPEIAAALDCGEGAARQTLFEARAALQARQEGRQMECEDARRAISDGDRRRLRGRKLRAHLNDCDGCSDFERAISARRRDLEALCPPLPLAAAAGIFAGFAGGSGAGVTGAGLAAVGSGAGGFAGGLAGTAAVKGASAAAALVLAAGAADATGVIEMPGPFDSGSDDSAKTGGPAPASKSREGGQSRATGHSGSVGGSKQSGTPQGRTGSGGGQSSGGPPARSNPGGKSGGHRKDAAPGQTGMTPGQSGTAPGRSGATPGQSDTAAPPGQAGTAPGLSGSTPGQSGSTPGKSGTAPGRSAESASSLGRASAGGSSAPTGGSSSPLSAPGEATAPGQSKPKR